MWIRTIALGTPPWCWWMLICHFGGASSRRMRSPQWAGPKTNGDQSLIMGGGTGNQPKSGRPKPQRGMDQVGELSNAVETLDLPTAAPPSTTSKLAISYSIATKC
jgi:hypothetical protein